MIIIIIIIIIIKIIIIIIEWNRMMIEIMIFNNTYFNLYRDDIVYVCLIYKVCVCVYMKWK